MVEEIKKRFKIVGVNRSDEKDSNGFSIIDFIIKDSTKNSSILIYINEKEFLKFLNDGNVNLLDLVVSKLREHLNAELIKTTNFSASIGIEFD